MHAQCHIMSSHDSPHPTWVWLSSLKIFPKMSVPYPGEILFLILMIRSWSSLGTKCWAHASSNKHQVLYIFGKLIDKIGGTCQSFSLKTILLNFCPLIPFWVIFFFNSRQFWKDYVFKFFQPHFNVKPPRQRRGTGIFRLKYSEAKPRSIWAKYGLQYILWADHSWSFCSGWKCPSLLQMVRQMSSLKIWQFGFETFLLTVSI